MTQPNSLGKDAQRLCIYIGESDRWRSKPLYRAILETLKTTGIAGATMVRGVAGFGAHSRIHTAAILRVSEDLPLRIEVIDTPDNITRAIEAISPMVREGLITLEPIQVVRYTHRYLNPLPADRPVSEVMTEKVITLTPEMPVAQAWKRMLAHLIKAMPVVTHTGEVVGMLTDEDILRCCGGLEQRISVAERLDAETIRAELAELASSPNKVEDVMSSPAITAQADEPLGAAAARMARHEIKRMPVVNAKGKLVGVLSRVDVLRLVMAAPRPEPTETLPPGAVQTVRQVMSARVPVVSELDGLAVIVGAFLESGSRRLVVVGNRGQAVGLISDADAVSRINPAEQRGILKALQRKGTAPDSRLTARDIMSPGVLAISPDTTLIEAINRILQERRKWMVVVDEQGRPLGLLDRQILLRALAATS